MDKIKSSSSSLDKNALNAMENMKTWMNRNENMLTKQFVSKQNEIHQNLANISKLKQQQIDLYKFEKNDFIFLRIDNVKELISKRKAMQIEVVGKIDLFLSSVNTQKSMIEQQIANICDNKFNECFYSHFIQT